MGQDMKMLSSIMKANTENLPPQNQVLGVSGSPRKNGNSDFLLKQVLKGVSQENTDCNSVQLSGLQFQGCIGFPNSQLQHHRMDESIH